MADKQTASVEAPKIKRPSKRRIFKSPDGTVLSTAALKAVSKMDKDLIVYCNGEKKVVTPATEKKKEKVEYHVVYDVANPRNSRYAVDPSIDSPLCKQCGLFEHEGRNPFIPYGGSKEPLVTILFDGLTRAEDANGVLGSDGSPSVIRRIIEQTSQETGISLEDVRWVPLSRCANWLPKAVNLKTTGNWCRYHAIQDIMEHPPTLLMPVGTTALGLLSHKSNAQEWTGRLLTYRGWPDDWLMNPKYALPRPDPRDEKNTVVGHPIFGSIPKTRLPMVPIQAPRLIFFTQNPVVRKRWEKSIVRALKMAKQGVKALVYTRPWYRFTANIPAIKAALKEILRHPGMLVCYDTETTGLLPWAPDAAIVSIMFRWTDPETGEPRSIGFPWDYGPTEAHPDYEESPVRPFIPELQKFVWKVLVQSKLVGHNLTFDMLYTYATFWREHLVGWEDRNFNLWRDRKMVALADHCLLDTWHMAFAWMQKPGSLGLEVLAYDWVPDLAGYEEGMTLMIGLYAKRMHPGEGEGGHYLNCPRDVWDSHVVPYVMGDVEVCYRAHDQIQAKLETSNVYIFPLAHPYKRGRFRYFEPPNRDWVYHQIMSPAARVLMKMMARGMYVDEKALGQMETLMPRRIKQLREDLIHVHPAIENWCKAKEAKGEAEGEKWQLDLENKGQLKELLFDVLDLPVLRLTKQGRKLFGDDIDDVRSRMCAAVAAERPDIADNEAEINKVVEGQLREVAAVDKFTLNKLLVKFDKIRPLAEYRKLFKLYSTYVRPLKNLFTKGLDKKERTHERHLCFDSCIHAQFLLTGTRGGRLCVAGDTKLQVRVNGKEITVDICDVWRYKDQRVTVKTHKGAWKNIVRLYFKGREQMYEVTTAGGCKIKATAGHKILTRRGWVSIGDLTESDSVRVDRPRGARPNFESRLILQASPGGKTELSRNKWRDLQTCGSSELARLPKLEKEAGRAASGQASGCTKRQRKRAQETFNDNTGGGIGKVDSARFADGSDRKDFSNDAVFSRTEHPDVWVAEIGQCASARQNLDGVSVKTDGGSLPRTRSSFCSIFHRQGAVFQKGLSSVCNAAGSSMVFEGHVPNAVYALERGLRRNGGNLLVNESTRVGTIAGIDVPWHSAFSRICLQRQPACRFWADRHEYFDRDRWRVPHRSADSGLHGGSGKAGLSRASFYDKADSIQHGRSDQEDTGCFERIVHWHTLGVQEVWDIEVEEDHSYVAQGLFHHNSCRNPNLQQLPRDGEVKAMFVSRFGERGCMYQGDLSQIELRLMAAACGDPTMLKAYFDDIDLHSLTASRIYDTPYDHFTKKHMEELQVKGHAKEAKELELNRTTAKTVNFLTGYGGGAFGLQNVLAMKGIYKEIEECQEIIERFFDSYPSLRSLLQQYKRFILDTHVAVSILGRVRVFEEVRGDDDEAKAKALRAGCNHLIQSTASDMMLTALFVIEAKMRDAGLESILVSTVHDSLVIDAIRDELPVVHDIVSSVLNNFPDVFKAVFGLDYDTSWMIVPFTGDCDVGLDYLSMNKIPKKNIDWDKLLAT